MVSFSSSLLYSYESHGGIAIFPVDFSVIELRNENIQEIDREAILFKNSDSTSKRFDEKLFNQMMLTFFEHKDINSLTDYLKVINDCKISSIVRNYQSYSQKLNQVIDGIKIDSSNLLGKMSADLLNKHLALLTDESKVIETFNSANSFYESVKNYNIVKDLQIGRSKIINEHFAAISFFNRYS
jgi:hypothetical protein